MTNKIHKNENKHWTDSHLNYIETNYGVKDIEEMSKYLGRSVEAIKCSATKL